MENNMIIPELNKETIESMIYTIRGQKVMLDFDLAKIYGYETKRFNEQVKNNKEKFPNDLMLRLNKNEVFTFLRSKKSTIKIASGSGHHSKYLPYAFTEQGIYMLMTVLKGELATKQSLALVRAFKQMKDYIVESNGLAGSNEVIKLVNTVNDHSRRLDVIENKLDIVMDNFIDPSTYKHYLILDGEKIEADIAYQEIYKKAKKSIYLIDDYIDIKTLHLLKAAKDNLEIVLISDNKAKNRILDSDIKESSLNIRLLPNGRCHDRYIIIDYNTPNEKIYLSGASSKDAGNKVTTIMQIEQTDLYHGLIDDLVKSQFVISRNQS